MKTKKWLPIILGVLLFLVPGILYFFKETSSTQLADQEKENPTFCIPIQLAGFSHAKIPYLRIEIENKSYFFILDLGFEGDTTISSEYLSEIQDKTFIKSEFYHGFRGKKYSHNVYKIPEIKIGKVSVHPVMMDEENKSFKEDAEIILRKEIPPVVTAGSVGWMLFNKATLYLDLGHSMIAVCDSVQTFKEEFDSLDKFSKVSMIDNNGFIEIDTMTSNGSLRCVLDSGCSFNLLHKENLHQESLDKIAKNEKTFVKFSTFQIGDKNCGPITFRPFPIHFPVHVDAILGVDFLLEHVVFIDFVNRELYFAKSKNSD